MQDSHRMNATSVLTYPKETPKRRAFETAIKLNLVGFCSSCKDSDVILKCKSCQKNFCNACSVDMHECLICRKFNCKKCFKENRNNCQMCTEQTACLEKCFDCGKKLCHTCCFNVADIKNDKLCFCIKCLDKYDDDESGKEIKDIKMLSSEYIGVKNKLLALYEKLHESSKHSTGEKLLDIRDIQNKIVDYLDQMKSMSHVERTDKLKLIMNLIDDCNFKYQSVSVKCNCCNMLIISTQLEIINNDSSIGFVCSKCKGSWNFTIASLKEKVFGKKIQIQEERKSMWNALENLFGTKSNSIFSENDDKCCDCGRTLYGNLRITLPNGKESCLTCNKQFNSEKCSRCGKKSSKIFGRIIKGQFVCSICTTLSY